MGNSTSNSTKIKQQVQNNLLSVQDNQCFAKSDVSASGNTVFFNGGKYGNATAVAITGDMNVSCSINQQIVQSATSILQSQANQVAKTTNDLFNDGVIFSKTKTSASILQSIINNFSNISTNTCNAIVSLNANNNTVIANGTQAGNFIGVSVNSNPNATCAITNLSSQDAYNRQQGNVDQSAKSTGMFVTIILAILTCLTIGVIVIVIIFAVGGAGVLIVGGKKKGDATEEEKQNKEFRQKVGQEFFEKILESK